MLFRSVDKEDTGTASNAESEKGLASDSFKRACFNWGIGRELYEYPDISVKLNGDGENDKGEWIKAGSNGKPQATWNLKIKDWKWSSTFSGGAIVSLSASDQNGINRFSWGVETITRDQAKAINDAVNSNDGMDMDGLLKMVSVSRLGEIPVNRFESILKVAKGDM